jgi:tRNA nucleotidyltransferase (CCA-adding enzyme)
VDRHGETVWDHTLAVVDALRPYRMRLRIVALLHDIGKPQTRRATEVGPRFPDHGRVGAAIARDLLRRLKASNAEIDRAVHLIAHHDGVPAADAPAAQLRHWLRVVGREFLPDLFRLRFADARARSDAGASKLEEALALWRRVRELLRANPPLDVGELAIGGAELRRMGLRPGPLYGEILRGLLDRVIEDPSLNTRDRLLEIVSETNPK